MFLMTFLTVLVCKDIEPQSLGKRLLFNCQSSLFYQGLVIHYDVKQKRLTRLKVSFYLVYCFYRSVRFIHLNFFVDFNQHLQCILYIVIIFHYKESRFSLTYERQPHKMVKHTRTIPRQQLTNCLSVFDHIVGLALKGLT